MKSVRTTRVLDRPDRPARARVDILYPQGSASTAPANPAGAASPSQLAASSPPGHRAHAEARPAISLVRFPADGAG